MQSKVLLEIIEPGIIGLCEGKHVQSKLQTKHHFWGGGVKQSGIDLHGDIAIGAAVSEGTALFLEGNEVPYGHYGVVRHIEVEQFHTGEGVESTELTRRSGEVFSHKKAICQGKENNV